MSDSAALARELEILAELLDSGHPVDTHRQLKAMRNAARYLKGVRLKTLNDAETERQEAALRDAVAMRMFPLLWSSIAESEDPDDADFESALEAAFNWGNGFVAYRRELPAPGTPTRPAQRKDVS